jgi:hypothetical protein
MTRFRKSTITTLGILALALPEGFENARAYAGDARGTTQVHAINLKPLAAGTAADAASTFLAAESLVVGDSAEFFQPIRFTNMRMANVGMSVKSGNPLWVSSSLKLRFSQGGALHAEACQASFMGCVQIPTKPENKTFAVKLDGVELAIRPEQSPCNTGHRACSMNISSWGLNSLVTNKSFLAPPQILAIVQSPSHFDLMDAVNGKPFAKILTHEFIRDLGKLTKAHTHNTGALQITFEHGIAQFDFQNDQVLVANKHGLWLSSHGISAGAKGVFNPIARHIDKTSNKGAPLFLNRELAVWSSHFVSIARQANAVPKPQQPFVSTELNIKNVQFAKSHVLALGLNTNNALVVARFNAAKSVFTPLATYNLWGGKNQIENTVLVGETPFQLTSNGHYYHHKSGLKKLSSIANASTTLFHESGHAFERRNTSAGCQLAHNVQSSEDESQFLPSGFVLPCTFGGKIRASKFGVTASERNEFEFTTRAWIPLR